MILPEVYAIAGCMSAPDWRAPTEALEEPMAQAAPTNRPIRTYREFWPYYLQEHSRPQTRAIHYAGTAFAIANFLAYVATGDLWFVLGAVVSGYAFAWVGHFFIEKNRPATFTYPVWSLVSDFRMAWRWASGRLGPDLERAGVSSSTTKVPRPR
jgi:hypothetical protein